MKQVRPFTGYHMATILVAFFAIVIAVNFVMARYAIETFGGTVVDNSYVASQKFNGWLKEARREREFGWKVTAPVRENDHLAVTITDSHDQPLTGAAMTMIAEHPLGGMPDRTLHFAESASGFYRSIETLPAGRWKLRAHADHASENLDLAFEVN
jgi:nitrogen fixation protein FixH